MTSEADLIAHCRKGDQSAINELFKQHYPGALRTARRIVPTEADAEDMVQSAFCSALQHLDRFRGEASFSTWITRIVMNKCLMELRDPWHKRRQRDGNPPANGPVREAQSLSPSPDRYTLDREVHTRLEVALAKMPAHLRTAFGLYAISELPLREVAATLDLSLAAAKTRVFRARKLLRVSLAKEAGIAGRCRPLADPSRRRN